MKTNELQKKAMNLGFPIVLYRESLLNTGYKSENTSEIHESPKPNCDEHQHSYVTRPPNSDGIGEVRPGERV